jgi:hypothetical protein
MKKQRKQRFALHIMSAISAVLEERAGKVSDKRRCKINPDSQEH